MPLPGRLPQFFEDDAGRLSMSRLLCFMAFFPASYVVIRTLTDATLGWYLGSFGGVYLGGKYTDMLKGRDHADNDSPMDH
jgi:hypothetical protein